MLTIHPGHERWPEFCAKLETALNFHVDEDGETRWACGDGEGNRFAHAERVAVDMGFGGLDLRGQHACCDCEVVFNLAPDSDDDS